MNVLLHKIYDMKQGFIFSLYRLDLGKWYRGKKSKIFSGLEVKISVVLPHVLCLQFHQLT